MHCTDNMLKPRVQRSRVHQMRHANLLNKAQPLDKGMLDQIKNESRRDAYKSVHRVIYYLLLVQLAAAFF